MSSIKQITLKQKNFVSAAKNSIVQLDADTTVWFCYAICSSNFSSSQEFSDFLIAACALHIIICCCISYFLIVTWPFCGTASSSSSAPCCNKALSRVFLQQRTMRHRLLLVLYYRNWQPPYLISSNSFMWQQLQIPSGTDLTLVFFLHAFLCGCLSATCSCVCLWRYREQPPNLLELPVWWNCR